MPPAHYGQSQLYEPYHDNHNFRGVMRIGEEVLNSVVPRFLADGWQVVSELAINFKQA